MAHLSSARYSLASVISRASKGPARRYASTWYYNPTELASSSTSNSGTWYNPTPSPSPSPPQAPPARNENINKEKVFIPKSVRRHTSTNPPRAEHCPGYYSFFKDLEHGFKNIPWPKKEDTHFHPDWMSGFKVIENYISQKEHDTFLAEVMDYSRRSHKVTHFDGRLVMNEMDTPFYPLFFNRLVNDGILEGPDRLAPNIYASGDGIPPHFDNIVHVKGTVCSIGLGNSDVIRFVNTPTGEIREVTVPPRSLYVMTNHSRYSCVHLIEPKPRKVPRISLVACDFYRPPIVEPDLGLTEFKDFVMMGSYGVWRHLDEMRGHTTLRQKVDLLTRFAKDHYPKQLPFFEKRFAAMAQHAEENNL